MTDININQLIIYILAIAGIISTLGGATAVIQRWWTNSKGMKNQEHINQLDKKVETLEYKSNKLEKHQKETDEFTKLMCNSMLALLNHEITGDSKDKLKEAKEEIEDYLINK